MHQSSTTEIEPVGVHTYIDNRYTHTPHIHVSIYNTHIYNVYAHGVCVYICACVCDTSTFIYTDTEIYYKEFGLRNCGGWLSIYKIRQASRRAEHQQADPHTYS